MPRYLPKRLATYTKTVKPFDSLKNDYELWPSNATKDISRFSPTQLQQILMGRDVVNNNNNKNNNNKINNNNNKQALKRSSEKRGGMEGCQDEMKPAKRKVIDQDDKVNTPELHIKKTNVKAMHCVRRLFPINSDTNCSPRDSESDSEFCKNLSQDSSSQSENSDWALKL